MSKIHELTGPEKAAILLLSLEQDQAAAVLRQLGDEEVSEIVTPHQAAMIETAGFEDFATIVQGRCAMCHAADPVWEGIAWPPKGVMLETHAQIAKHAKSIYIQSGVTHAMPPANVSFITEDERAQIIDWYRAVR